MAAPAPFRNQAGPAFQPETDIFGALGGRRRPSIAAASMMSRSRLVRRGKVSNGPRTANAADGCESLTDPAIRKWRWPRHCFLGASEQLDDPAPPCPGSSKDRRGQQPRSGTLVPSQSPTVMVGPRSKQTDRILELASRVGSNIEQVRRVNRRNPREPTNFRAHECQNKYRSNSISIVVSCTRPTLASRVRIGRKISWYRY